MSITTNIEGVIDIYRCWEFFQMMMDQGPKDHVKSDFGAV